MDILLLSEIHDNQDTLKRILLREEDNHRIILVLGNLGSDGTHQQTLELLNDHADLVKAIPGPNDTTDTMKSLIDSRMNLHRQVFSLEGCDFIGLGSIDDPQMDVEQQISDQEDQQIGSIIPALMERTSGRQIIATYRPPNNILPETDGSTSLRNLLQDSPPELLITGQDIGQQQASVNGCQVIAPGSVNRGEYAILNLENNNVDLKSL